MKRLLALSLVAAGLAAGAVPAQAAPWCGPSVSVRCTPNGHDFCQVYVAQTRTCVKPPPLPPT